MKYLCLVYLEEDKLHAVADRECLRRVAKRLRAGGQRRRRRCAAPGRRSATTLRLRDGALSMTDGPFAETKEQLAGFYLFDASDLDEALDAGGEDPAGAQPAASRCGRCASSIRRPRRRDSLSGRRRRRRAVAFGIASWRRPLRARRPT